MSAAPRRTVLVVEDDPDLREVLVDELAAGAHEVLAARNGAEALEQMRRYHPDIVVFDLLMPVMDGWSFRIEQKRDPELARTPVIAMSASGTPAAAAVDADLFVAKPFQAGTMIRAIDDVLAAQARRDALERSAHHERLAALGTLAAGLAHEINNPLTYIMLNLSAAGQLLPAIANDEARIATVGDLVGEAMVGAERIKALVRSVRILARDDTGARGPVELAPTIEAALTIAMHALRERARLVTRLDDTVPFVVAEEGRLGQVFLNLIINAVQAIPEGAPEANEVRISTSLDGAGRAVVEIADTGAGIPAELIPRVFEPFFTTKPVGQGTGLGLSVSHAIIRGLGGEITIESRVGHGTVVRVVLPAGDPA